MFDSLPEDVVRRSIDVPATISVHHIIACRTLVETHSLTITVAKEAVVSVFTRGDSFGEAVALQNLKYPVSAQSVSASEVMHISASVLVNLIKEDAEVGLSILASTFHHLHSLVSQLEQLKSRTGGQRVAEFLLNLCDCDSGPCKVTMPYDKILIAGRLGIKPESLSRAFSRLKKVGVRIDKNHASIDSVRHCVNILNKVHNSDNSNENR